MKPLSAPTIGACLLAAALWLPGCTPKVELEHNLNVDVKPIKIEPIYITIDVNIRVDKQLNDFFKFADEATPAKDSATQPAAPPPAGA